MPDPRPIVRSHLRLATTPAARRRSESRVALLARVLVVAAVTAWITLAAWVVATLALLPLTWRRAPLGRRLRPPAPREARVIPFQPRQPRQRALTR